jgi:fimbrial chaperone protein
MFMAMVNSNPSVRVDHLSGRWLRAAAAALLSLSAASAWADLMLYPTRVVFEKDQRAAQVELVNQGKTPETYRISVVNRRMGESGEFIVISEPGPGELFAESMLKYSPRQVTIPPGSSQTVRILLRKPADLAPGEYRSHLQFDRVADASGRSSVEDVGKDKPSGVGVILSALVGASIPVIVRHGDTQASVSLSHVALAPSTTQAGPAVSFDIQREGNRSVYGDLSVTFTPRQGAAVDAARASGVAVYAPNGLRRARMPLDLPQGAVMSGGTLRVSYRERAEAGGKLMAETSLVLP